MLIADSDPLGVAQLGPHGRRECRRRRMMEESPAAAEVAAATRLLLAVELNSPGTMVDGEFSLCDRIHLWGGIER